MNDHNLWSKGVKNPGDSIIDVPSSVISNDDEETATTLVSYPKYRPEEYFTYLTNSTIVCVNGPICYTVNMKCCHSCTTVATNQI